MDKKPQIMEDSPAYFRKIGDAFTLKMIEREGIMTRVAVPIFVGLEAVGTLPERTRLGTVGEDYRASGDAWNYLYR